MRRILIASLLLITVASPALAETQAPTSRRVGSATLQNVPDIPADVSEAVQRFQNSRAAQFEDWLPDGSMLIATRFGATQQIHHVAAPGGARTQLTFDREPVAGAVVIPGSERFVLTRDTGGDEWFQLYVRGIAGTAAPLTEPGTRNENPVFSKDGSLMVWSRATAGSARYTLLARNPATDAPARMLYQSDGAIAPADVSPDGRSLIFVRSISNREDQIFLLPMMGGTPGASPHGLARRGMRIPAICRVGIG